MKVYVSVLHLSYAGAWAGYITLGCLEKDSETELHAEGLLGNAFGTYLNEEVNTELGRKRSILWLPARS